MRRTTVVAVLLLFGVAGNMQAQQSKTQKSSQKSSGFMAASGMTKVYEISRGYLLKTAEQVPEDKYSYRPTSEVRTFGQILGHVADAHMYFCENVIGGKPAAGNAEGSAMEKLEGKAAITAALKKSFDTCDAVLAKLTDADLTRMVDLFGQSVPLSMGVTMLASHDFEHYGNLVTYMRSNGIVPPSSQGGGM